MGNLSFSTQRVAKIKSVVQDEIETHFIASLGQEPDILNIISAQIWHESRFNVFAIGSPVSYRPGTGGAAYLNSPVMKALFAENDPGKVARAFQGITALGVSQVMGWNFVRGASSSGRCELERIRPDLADDLTVAPGEDIIGFIVGEENLNKAVRAGLVILEGKYRAVYYTPEGYKIRGDTFGRLFPSKISGALAAYLGLGAADRNGTTPSSYAADIMGGKSYVAANGNGVQVKDTRVNVASRQGPSTNSTGQKPIGVPGCA